MFKVNKKEVVKRFGHPKVLLGVNLFEVIAFIVGWVLIFIVGILSLGGAIPLELGLNIAIIIASMVFSYILTSLLFAFVESILRKRNNQNIKG